MESSAVVIKKYGNRRRYDTAREHSRRLATASGQRLFPGRVVASLDRKRLGAEC